jgi:anaerobic selenocysteine-containing dehydrogenase
LSLTQKLCKSGRFAKVSCNQWEERDYGRDKENQDGLPWVCHGGCGVIAHVKDGKVIKVEGDPDSPLSYGTMCSKVRPTGCIVWGDSQTLSEKIQVELGR